MIITKDMLYIKEFLSGLDVDEHTYRVKFETHGDEIRLYSYDTIIFTIDRVKKEIMFDNSIFSKTTSKHQRAVEEYLDCVYTYDKYKVKGRLERKQYNFIIDRFTLVDKDLLTSIDDGDNK